MKIVCWIITIGYAGLIFYMSSRTWEGVPLFTGADKIIHLFIYAVLGGLLVWSLRATSLRGRHVILPLAIVMGSLYGLSDEIHQSFVPGRDASFFDFVSDTIGSALGAYFASYFFTHFRDGEKGGSFL